MKKFMLIAASAAIVLATGCAKNERLTSSNDEPHAIGFTNYTPKNITKAAAAYLTGATPVDGTHFAVYGWQTDNGVFLPATPGTPAPNFMNAVDVTWNDDTTTGEGNTYSPKQFWPSGDNPANLSFIAYYPYANETGITAPTFSSSVGTYAFTAKNTSATMVDFCVSDVVNDQVYGSTNAGASYKNTVKFTFRHALTKVRFQFKKASGLDEDGTTVIELLDAELSGIKNSGTLTATYAQYGDPDPDPAVNAIGTTTLTWSAQAGTQGYEVTLNNVDPETANPIVLGESVNSTHNNDYFLMVPQDMEDDTQKITISWRVRVYDTSANATANAGTAVGGMLSETVNTKTISLYDGLVTTDGGDTPRPTPLNWEINDFITYTITIGPKPIWFTAVVANWSAEEFGYITVQ